MASPLFPLLRAPRFRWVLYPRAVRRRHLLLFGLLLEMQRNLHLDQYSLVLLKLFVI